VAELQATLQQQQTLRARIDQRLIDTQANIESLNETNADRAESMTPTEQRLLKRDVEQLRTNRNRLAEQFNQTAASLQAIQDGLSEENRAETVAAIISLNVDMTNLLSELTLIEARARLESISIESIELSPAEALEIARSNRLDWMNNRAALVDTWRLIEFNGNRLESNLDVVLSGEMGTVGDNSVKFQARDTTVSAGLRFDTPFNRRVERNDFRQQLIFYQQARRQMIQYEDGVNRGLRTLLRELEQLRVNLEIQRRAVAISIRRVDQTPPAQPGQPVVQFGPTAALNLLTALSDLRSSQNNFMSVWLNYHAGRMRLLRDLGIIRIDDEGLWIEESVQDALNAAMAGVPVEMPPDVPALWYETLDNLPEPEDAEQGNGEANLAPHIPDANRRGKLKEPAASPGVDVAQNVDADLETADAGLVERLLGTRFANLFAGRRTTDRQPEIARNNFPTADATAASAKTTSEMAVLPDVTTNTETSATPLENKVSSEDPVRTARGETVRIPLPDRQIRPASFSILSPSSNSAPAKIDQPAAPGTLTPAPAKRSAMTAPEPGGKQPLKIQRGAGSWRPTSRPR
jgi:hypothetical protein